MVLICGQPVSSLQEGRVDESAFTFVLQDIKLPARGRTQGGGRGVRTTPPPSLIKKKYTHCMPINGHRRQKVVCTCSWEKKSIPPMKRWLRSGCVHVLGTMGCQEQNRGSETPDTDHQLQLHHGIRDGLKGTLCDGGNYYRASGARRRCLQGLQGSPSR